MHVSETNELKEKIGALILGLAHGEVSETNELKEYVDIFARVGFQYLVSETNELKDNAVVAKPRHGYR